MSKSFPDCETLFESTITFLILKRALERIYLNITYTYLTARFVNILTQHGKTKHTLKEL